jgi:predicted aspartyl protease
MKDYNLPSITRSLLLAKRKELKVAVKFATITFDKREAEYLEEHLSFPIAVSYPEKCHV